MTISPGSQATSSAGPPVKSKRRELLRTRPALLKFPPQKKGTSRPRPGIRGPRPLLPCLAVMHDPRLQETGRMAIAAPALQPLPPVARPGGRMRRRSGSLIIGLRPSMEHTRQQARVRLPTIRVSSSPISSLTRDMALVLSRTSSGSTDSQASSVRTASHVRTPARTPRAASLPARAPMCLSDPAASTVGLVPPTTPAAT